MKEGQTKNGIERRNTDGNRLPGKTAVSVHTTTLNASGKRSLAKIDVVVTTVKEKTNTWNKSWKESAKRESELYKMVEQAAIDERQEHKEKCMIKDMLHDATQS